MTGVGYARLSKRDRNEAVHSRSIESQFVMIRRRWEELDEGKLLLLSDDGYSGRDPMRPAFRRLLGLVALGEVDVVIVRDFSRLCRDYLLFGILCREIFVKNGVRLIAISECYDSLYDCEDTIGLDLRALFNEYYCHDISRKVKTALAAGKKQGNYSMMRPPYGYRRASSGTGWEVVEEEAELVRLIYSLRCEGKSLCKICDELQKVQQGWSDIADSSDGEGESEEISLPRKRVWEPAVVWQILNNPVYRGCQVWHKYETLSQPYGTVVSLPQREWQIREGMHPAVLPPAAWEPADSDGRQRKKRHIFHGLTKCAACGRALVRARHDAGMLCCCHCSGREEKRIGVEELYQLCQKTFRQECLRIGGEGEQVIRLERMGESGCREHFVQHFIRRIEVTMDGDVTVYWNFGCS